MTALGTVLIRDLWHLRGQVTAAALVLACGVTTLVAMVSTYQSLRQAQATYYATGRFADVFVHVKRAPESLAARLRLIPGVAALDTRVVMEVILDVPGLAEPATGRLVSIPDRRIPMLNELFIRSGRYVEERRPDEVLVSEAFATANRLAVGDRIGAILNGRWRRLAIAGIALSPEYVYEVGGGSILPDNRRFGILWMGRTALASAFDLDQAFNDVALALAAGAVRADVIDRLDGLLRRYGSLGAYARDEQLSHRFLTDEIGQNRVTATYVPAVFFGVAAFLLHIVLSRLVAMRRTEIGLLKAFGYADRVVGLHYLKLALAATSLGVIVGVAAGLALGQRLTAMYALYYHFPALPFVVGGWPIALAVAASAAIAVVGALTSARRAMRMPPAEAMRPEPAPRFTAGVIERVGLTRWLPASARMIWRNLARRPWRAASSVLGIACAAGILVVGGYFFDAFEYLLHVQFGVIQREDATVIFTNPRSAGARFELGRLPGVGRVEPYRAVPARLHAGHRSKRVELTGVSPGPELRRLVDRRLAPIDLPPEGLVLTTELAKRLAVAPGDTLTVEVLEGERPTRPAVVAGLADEWLGLAAYMDIRALNRLVREGETVSGAYLQVEPRQAGRLYAALKQTPAVSAVATRETLVQSVRELLARSLYITMAANLVLAGVIAFGMVYNAARISLSERANELASLRVLGFSRREVATILLGEQAVLTVSALPVGMALGYAVCVLLAHRLATELYRLPLVVAGPTYALAGGVVLAAAVGSGILVARRLGRLDLVAVLKTRE